MFLSWPNAQWALKQNFLVDVCLYLLNFFPKQKTVVTKNNADKKNTIVPIFQEITFAIKIYTSINNILLELACEIFQFAEKTFELGNLLKRKKDGTVYFGRETLSPYTKNMED